MAKKPKFKIGDKVYVIDPGAPHYNMIGEVVDIDINAEKHSGRHRYLLYFDSLLAEDRHYCCYLENHLFGVKPEGFSCHANVNSKDSDNNGRRIFETNNFNIGDVVRVTEGGWSGTVGCVIGIPAGLPDNIIPEITVELHPYGHKIIDTCRADWLEPIQIPVEAAPDDFKVGDRIMVSGNAKAYKGAYAFVLGRIIQFYNRNSYRNSDGKKLYGVRLYDRDNPKSANGLFWFHEDELLHVTIDNTNLNALKSIRKAAAMTNQNPKPSLVEKVIVNGSKTIVFWNDGTKTIVSCREGEEFDIYTAFCAALAKKMFGSTSRTKAILEDKLIIQEKKDKKKPDDLNSQKNCSFDTLLQNEIANSIEELKKLFLEAFDHD